MDHPSPPAEVNTIYKEAEPADDNGYAGKLSPAVLATSFPRCESYLTDASSVYSDNASTDASDKSSGNQRPLDVALPYLKIVAGLRTSLFPSNLEYGSFDGEVLPAELVERYSTPSSVRTENIHHATQSAASSKASVGPTSGGDLDAFRPVMCTLPCSRANSGLKAVRFQDTADDLAAPSMDPSEAKCTLPLQVEGVSMTKSRTLRATRSVLKLLWPRRSKTNVDVMSAPLEENDQMRLKLDSGKHTQVWERRMKSINPRRRCRSRKDKERRWQGQLGSADSSMKPALEGYPTQM